MTEYRHKSGGGREYMGYECGDGIQSIWWCPDGKAGLGRGFGTLNVIGGHM